MLKTTPTLTFEEIVKRNAIEIEGQGDPSMLFMHGFGCDQNMWRFTIPVFKETHRIIRFDHVGAGKSDLSQYDFQKYSTLDGYVQDLLQICASLSLGPCVLVGHSVSAIIAALAAAQAPSQFQALVMVAPSPCYLNAPGYFGGFEKSDLDGLIDMLNSNYLGWAGQMASVVMGSANEPWMVETLEESFCRTDPKIARHFAEVTFYSDNRNDLSAITTPTLILQCSDDLIAPQSVGRFVHEQIPDSDFVLLEATGHCPHISAPVETISAIQTFLSSRSFT